MRFKEGDKVEFIYKNKKSVGENKWRLSWNTRGVY